MVADPLLTEGGWSWLTDALDRYGAGYTEVRDEKHLVLVRRRG